MSSDSIVTAAVPVGRIAEACGFCNVATSRIVLPFTATAA